jgi:hypothetical protein
VLGKHVHHRQREHGCWEYARPVQQLLAKKNVGWQTHGKPERPQPGTARALFSLLENFRAYLNRPSLAEPGALTGTTPPD